MNSFMRHKGQSYMVVRTAKCTLMCCGWDVGIGLDQSIVIVEKSLIQGLVCPSCEMETEAVMNGINPLLSLVEIVDDIYKVVPMEWLAFRILE